MNQQRTKTQIADWMYEQFLGSESGEEHEVIMVHLELFTVRIPRAVAFARTVCKTLMISTQYRQSCNL